MDDLTGFVLSQPRAEHLPPKANRRCVDHPRSTTRPNAPESQPHPPIAPIHLFGESLGRFKNAGTDYRGQGDPLRANVHAFEDKTLGKVAPYGVYGAIANQGRVSVGITADVAEFAVASIRCWFERMGRRRLSHVAVAHLYGSDLWGDMIQWGHYHSRNRD
jgi:hypothetical protein